MERPIDLNFEEMIKAQAMLDELRAGRHEVVLVAVPEERHSGHKMRVLASSNASWYSDFCSRFLNCRGIGRKRMKRPRTYIKKEHVDRALEKMAETGEVTTINQERLADYLRESYTLPEERQEESGMWPEEEALLQAMKAKKRANW